MGVIVDVVELKSSIPASRVFKALFDSNNLMPKVLPRIFKSIELIEGNGGAGSIKLISFQEGDVVKTMKERVEKVDERNRVYSVTVVESESMGEDLESIHCENKVEDGGDGGGGSIIKATTTYTTKGENQARIQEKITKAKQARVVVFEAVQSYLLSNPNEYN